MYQGPEDQWPVGRQRAVNPYAGMGKVEVKCSECGTKNREDMSWLKRIADGIPYVCKPCEERHATEQMIETDKILGFRREGDFGTYHQGDSQARNVSGNSDSLLSGPNSEPSTSDTIPEQTEQVVSGPD